MSVRCYVLEASIDGLVHLAHRIPMWAFEGAKNPAWLLWNEARIVQRKITVDISQVVWSCRLESLA